MFKSKTVFVLGAGASKEANLPIGTELKEQIAEALDIRFDFSSSEPRSGNRSIVTALRYFVKDTPKQDINPFLHQAWRIRDAMPQAISIDNFIDAHAGNTELELCGKLAITICILAAERQSQLFFNQFVTQNPFPFDRITTTWYNIFFQLLTENVRQNELENVFENIAFIDFNYDRCVPFFLFHALQNYYGISDEEAAAFISRLEIRHPYGFVGALPFQDQREGVPFGAEPASVKTLDIAGRIKTFTEQTNDAEAEEAIRSLIRDADKIIFLGFAFHELNMSLLEPRPREHTQSKFLQLP